MTGNIKIVARLAFTVIAFITLSVNCSAQRIDWKKMKVLIYTKNGKGYVHDNIPSAVASLEKIATGYGFSADVSDDPSKFNEENLKQYSFLIFPSTNQDVFDTDEQRVAFRRYIEAGGGFVGLHSVIGTERSWDWFKKMLGGSFAWHPPFQKYTIKVLDASHPSVAGMPDTWVKDDECYFIKEMYPGVRAVLAHDLSTLDPKDKDRITTSAGPYGQYYPAAWYQQYDGGNIWITALGHDKKDYEDPTYVRHIVSGITWVATQSKVKPDYKKAYATQRDQPLQVTTANQP
jgi:type 1 glutamine amidotransferase